MRKVRMFHRAMSRSFQTKANFIQSNENLMIKLKGVTKLYQHFAVVKDVEFEVRDGEILGIIGHNGAGKTTILKIITGLVVPTEGTIEVSRDSR